VALDRQYIEKKDFPIGRRGYEPEAVDSHLQALANEVESLKRSSNHGQDTLASAASEQVRAIVEAAEKTASEIQRTAQQEARRLGKEATEHAQKSRQAAVEEARSHVEKVAESSARMLEKLDAMEKDFGELVGSLRDGAARLRRDLEEVHSSVADLGGERPAAQAAPTAAAAAAPEAKAAADPKQKEPAELVAAAVADGEGAASHPPPPAGASDDADGARLIALNMALNGTPRDEADKYLAENFDLEDRTSLLDEVYARVDS
jgi:vacuolar-type H+-ATPase subunit H